ncbi:MAG: glycosyltransferase family 4 protein [Bacteroidia bacterium]|jgi:glycogen synthase
MQVKQRFEEKRILMLGWEFPPVHAGGLGIACYGLTKAIRNFIDITLVVPKSDPRMQLEGVRIFGLNEINENLGITEPEMNRLTGGLPELEYYQLSAVACESVRKGYQAQQGLKRTSFKELFGDEEVYGPRLLAKVSAYAEAVAEEFGDGGFDLIHAHDWLTYLAGVRLKKKTGKPLLIHVHALETDRAGRDARNTMYYVERFGMQMCDRIIAVSEYTKQNIVELYGIQPEKIEAIHNGIDPQDVFRAEHHVPEKIVAFVGRLTHQKGPYHLLETAEKVIRRFPHVRFVVAGTGEKMKELIDWTAFKGLSRHFLFTGFVAREKVEQLLAVADVYFMPSVSEPFGLSALEAAQFNVPCVISKQSGVAEMLKHSLQADYWDTDAFAEHIIKLLADENYHREMVEAMQQDLEHISWDDAATRVIKEYRKFLLNES